MFREAWALEKIHGSSSHIEFKQHPNNRNDWEIKFFSGGESHERFVSIFNQDELLNKFKSISFNAEKVTIFGEVYGGKCQGMSATYGKELKFIAFDVCVNDKWLDIPMAESIVKTLGLDFVPYKKIQTTLTEIDAERDYPSIVAINNGCGNDKIREGIVLRPLIELTRNNGERICAKHKRDEFRETKTPRPVVDPAKLEILRNAELVVNEWVTENRLIHVLDKIPDYDITKTGTVIKNMIEDVKIEGKDEIEWSKEIEKLIGTKTAKMFKEKLNNKMSEENIS